VPATLSVPTARKEALKIGRAHSPEIEIKSEKIEELLEKGL
jgi:hypothetical protein